MGNAAGWARWQQEAYPPPFPMMPLDFAAFLVG
jgi:hypothetical protein